VKEIYLLSDKKIKGTFSLPMLDIEYLKSTIDFKSYDGIIFTSKNAIYSIDSFNPNWKQIPSLAIAKQTANEIIKLDGTLEFTGIDGHGDNFAQEILANYKNKKLLYPRGDKVVSNLVTILNQNNIICDEKIIYKTVCKTYKNNQTFKPDTIFIFTSPSTIKCFLDNNSWQSSFTAICIGKTTASFFPDYIKPIVSKITSVQSCVDMALHL
jgi:uroporphyrinogen-III synthase